MLLKYHFILSKSPCLDSLRSPCELLLTSPECIPSLHRGAVREQPLSALWKAFNAAALARIVEPVEESSEQAVRIRLLWPHGELPLGSFRNIEMCVTS